MPGYTHSIFINCVLIQDQKVSYTTCSAFLWSLDDVRSDKIRHLYCPVAENCLSLGSHYLKACRHFRITISRSMMYFSNSLLRPSSWWVSPCPRPVWAWGRGGWGSQPCSLHSLCCRAESPRASRLQMFHFMRLKGGYFTRYSPLGRLLDWSIHLWCQ